MLRSFVETHTKEHFSRGPLCIAKLHAVSQLLRRKLVDGCKKLIFTRLIYQFHVEIDSPQIVTSVSEMTPPGFEN